MKTKLKKLAVLMVMTLVMLFGAACDASVSYYYSTDAENRIHDQFEVFLPTLVVKTLEDNAAYYTHAFTSPQQWKLTTYFLRLSEVTPIIFDNTTLTDGGYVYSFRLVSQTPSSSGGSSDVERTITNGFYYNTVTQTQKNPLADLAEAYDNLPPITISPGDNSRSARLSRVLRAIKYGGDNGQYSLPALDEAFPTIEASSVSDLTLEFYWAAAVKAENGDTVRHSSIDWAHWTVDEGGQIIYSYKVVNPVGWYVTIILVGIAVVAIIFLATMKSTSEPKMEPFRPIRSGYRKANSSPRVYVDPKTFDIYSENPPDPDSARRELEDIFSGKTDNKDDKDKK